MANPHSPHSPIAAVIHPDPYPYYATLTAERPLYFDEALHLWVASSAEAVTAVLTNSLCRVRPASEPIPKALLGSPAANIFRHLVRMNDGERHCPFKQVIATTLGSVSVSVVATQSRRWAYDLITKLDPSDFALRLSVYVMGSLLGIPHNDLHQTTLWVDDFVRCLAPASSLEQIDRGKLAAGHLLNLFRTLLNAQTDGLLTTLIQEMRRVGRDDSEGIDVIVANAIGFLTQAYEATAGLIGNAVLAMAAYPDVREQITAKPELLHNVIEEVLRYDSPIQNTRRFVAEAGIVAGQPMQAGDAILVVLAAANRDASVNPHPEQFDLFRQERRLFTFGLGTHACPGEMLAVVIAQAGVEQLIAHAVVRPRMAEALTYRPSANVRIPFLTFPRT